MGLGGDGGDRIASGAGGGGAGLGGAIYNAGGDVTVTDSELTNNEATGGVGGELERTGARADAIRPSTPTALSRPADETASNFGCSPFSWA